MIEAILWISLLASAALSIAFAFRMEQRRYQQLISDFETLPSAR